jgi:hypothetical protein
MKKIMKPKKQKKNSGMIAALTNTPKKKGGYAG